MILLKSKRFIETYYTKAGVGFPIILLHGFAENHTIWKNQIEYLSKNFTVIAIDIPGSGMSSLPTETMSMELIADVVYEIILKEKIDKTILFGHSMGGYATLSFAKKYSEKLLGFGLIHSTSFADNEEKILNRKKSIQLIENNGKDVFLNAMIPNLYSDISKEEIKEEIRFHLTIAKDISSRSLVAYYKAMIDRNDTRAVLQNNLLPILFIAGKEDTAVMYKDILAQAIMPQKCMVELLENVGHTSMLENSKKVNSILNNYCKYVLENKND